MKIGIVFGCFIPMHTGHMKLINRAFTENDLTIIAVCGKAMDRGKDFIPFRDRVELITQLYSLNYRFKVVVLDDEKLGMDGSFSRDNWIKWSAELFRQANVNPEVTDVEFTWYTGEPSYQEKLSSIYPNHNFVVVDRSEDTISGTQIRENPKKYYYHIAPSFLEYLQKKGYEI